MIKCLMDVSVPENSKCAKCCIYCDEKNKCNYVCDGIEEWETEENIVKNCTECFYYKNDCEFSKSEPTNGEYMDYSQLERNDNDIDTIYSGIVIKPYWGFEVGDKIYIKKSNIMFSEWCADIYRTEELSSFVVTVFDIDTLKECVKLN